MDRNLFEQLLYEEESTTVEFKKEPYRFVKATEEEKSELLKDIIGFANAWRRSEAFILIGVEEVRGARSNVIGIANTDHLEDHSLQQFVNSLTNRPVRFRYEAFGFEGNQVGIIRIEEQPRPIYLKRDYGKLEKEKVYIRRGSSTNSQKPASLEEIASMGQSAVPQSAELTVEFADVERDEFLGSSMSWDTELCKMPEMDIIPDLTEPEEAFVLLRIRSLVENRLNRDFYREWANFEFYKRAFHAVRLVLRNVGRVSASNVQAEFIISKDVRVIPLSRSEFPQLPKKKTFSIYDTPGLRDILSSLQRYPGQTTINSDDDRFRIEIDFGDLQPGKHVRSDVFYLGKAASGDVAISGRIFAGNLPQPKDFTLTLSGKLKETSVTIPELLSLPPDEEEKD